MKRYLAATAILLSGLTSNVADARADPSTGQIEAFHQALLSARKLSQGRINILLPVLERTFNFPVMAKFIIGVSWPDMSEADPHAVNTALQGYTAGR